jgi:signal transduction histidine kinase
MQFGGELDCLGSTCCLADDVESMLSEQRGERLARQRMVVHDKHALVHDPLIGTNGRADEGEVKSVHPSRAEAYRSWLVGELVLVALLGGATAYFGLTSSLRGYALPEARLALDTTVAVCATIVATLAAIRFLVEGRVLDLLLASSFVTTGVGTLAFGVVPVLGGRSLDPEDTWTVLAVELMAAAVIAVAPFVSRRIGSRRQALAAVGSATGFAIVACWLVVRGIAPTRLTTADGSRIFPLTGAFAGLALLGVVAVVGFGLRYRHHGRDFDSWVALALTLTLFAELHYVLSPVLSNHYVLPGDLLRLLSYGVLLVGVWRAISEAEFGRAVADERARVAREIHDGLAQYLFALSTQVSMLESGAELAHVLPRLKLAMTAAQQEAQFAVLALSSAAGSAPFDAALRRYVDFLVADGTLDVEVEIDPDVLLAPDEEIEVFRIVQEGLANAKRHAGAGQAEVAILQRGGRRIVRVSDNGTGIKDEDPGAGQGLRNMRSRAASIQGVLSLRSSPGKGTSIEVILRPI